jgi:hypothetical protein
MVIIQTEQTQKYFMKVKKVMLMMTATTLMIMMMAIAIVWFITITLKIGNSISALLLWPS